MRILQRDYHSRVHLDNQILSLSEGISPAKSLIGPWGSPLDTNRGPVSPFLPSSWPRDRDQGRDDVNNGALPLLALRIVSPMHSQSLV